MLVEMLGWHDERVRQAAATSCYFDDKDLQKDTKRLHVLMETLTEDWGKQVADLFMRVWRSKTLHDCPTFGEWLVTLPEDPGHPNPSPVLDPDTMLLIASDLEREEKPACALEIYQRAKSAPTISETQSEVVTLALERLEVQVSSTIEEQEEAPETEEKPDSKPDRDPEPISSGDMGEIAIADLFDDGLAAFQQDEWRAARELFNEVIRQAPDYQRHGWEARKLLDSAEEHLITPWQRALKYGGRILLSSLLVLIIVSLASSALYMAFVRPIVTDSLFTVLRPMLNELTTVTDQTGCVISTETAVNAGLDAMVPYLVEHNDLQVNFPQGRLRGSASLGSHTIWLEAVLPKSSSYAQDFEIEQLNMHWLLRILFTPEQLKAFIESYVNEELIGLDRNKILRLGIEIDDKSMEICTR